MRRRVRVMILALSFVLLVNVIAFAIDEEKELKQTQQKKSNLEGQLKENKNEIKDYSKEIENLDLQISKSNKELEEANNQLNKLNKNIEITTAELEESEKNIEDKNDTFNSRLRVMYKNGSVGYLEVLLASEDIGDFLTRLDMVQSIIKHDVDLLKYMKEQRQIIAEKKVELEAQRSSVAAARKQLEIKKQDLVIATRAKENLIREIEKDNKLLSQQIDKLNKEADELISIIRSKQSTGAYVGGEMLWPVPGRTRISSPFGYRIHPILKVKKMHTGIDIPAPTGHNILASNGGTVQHAGWLGGYGQVVWIDHGGGRTSLYAHNSKLLVKVGQKVNKGDVIAKAGSTGNSTGPHLHFEIREDGNYKDPIPYLKGN